MEYDLQLIGARLQAARKAKGYTQDYVSARADITEKFLSQIERGKAGLSVQTLIALCDILEITPNYVLLPDAARAGGADWPFAEGHEPAAASGRGGDGAHFCAQLPPRGKGQAQGRAQKHAVNARRAVTRPVRAARWPPWL